MYSKLPKYIFYFLSTKDDNEDNSILIFQLDYIPRLMWQGQVKGNKSWSVVPVPECEHVCQKFDYYVEPGDVGKTLTCFYVISFVICTVHLCPINTVLFGSRTYFVDDTDYCVMAGTEADNKLA